MDFNKNIFFKFLNSKDWNHEKTFSLFQRLHKEKDELINELKEEVKKQKSNYNEIKKITDITFEKYDDCLILCEKLKEENKNLKNKKNKTIGIQTYVQNVKHAIVKYENNENIPTITEPPSPKKISQNSISQLNLDTLWDEAKDIMDNKEPFKDKNRDLIVLFVDYKKNLIKLMGRDWYNKCRNCVQEYTNLSEKEHISLYSKLINLLTDVFQNEW